MRRSGVLLLLAACGPPPAPGPPPDADSAPGLPLARLNDNREPAGRMVGDTLVVELDLVQAAWTPRGPDGPRIATAAFAQPGGEPSVPGPLVRTNVGTPVRFSVTNRLERSVRFERQITPNPLMALFSGESIDPGARLDVVWTPDRPLTTVYGARDGSQGPGGGQMGVIVVDPAGATPDPRERIMHITAWGSRDEPGSLSSRASFKLFVNGRSWPFTERLEYQVGDTVVWRVVNSSLVRHPMHLHGFYFTVLSAGDLRADTIFEPDRRHEVVTHVLTNLASMTLQWIPEEPGNWIFHCHLMRHMGASQRFANDPAPESSTHGGMAGLITGITIRPGPGAAEADPEPLRRIDLWTGATANGWGDGSDRLSFVVQRDDAPPAVDSTEAPSSLLVLRRDEPTEIVVHNRLDIPLSLHWHGLELRSQYDGVSDWSGMPSATLPPIPPGSSRSIMLAPPRAGTFMYHTHGEPGHELSQGLYGPLIVLDPDEEHSASNDRFYLLTSGGGARDAPPAVNGVLEPAPEHFEPGRTYRLRFGEIAADESKLVRLLRDGEPVLWTPVAKDGADLPGVLRAPVPAQFSFEVGETMDFEWTPEPGLHQLVVTTVPYPLDARRGPTQTIAFVVGDVLEAEVIEANRGFETVISSGTLFLMALGAIVLVLLITGGLTLRFLVRRVRSWRRAAA